MQTLYIHPDNPQERLIQQAAKALQDDKLIIYPTDTSYAFGASIHSKHALEQLKHIRQLDDKHNFTLLCQDLSQVASFAVVDNHAFRILKNNTPSAITFILEASKDTPKKLAHPKKKTIGIRIPTNPIALSLLKAVGEPILTSSLILPDAEGILDEPFEIEDRLSNLVDLFIHIGTASTHLSTVVDMAGSTPILVRQGLGDVSGFAE